MKNTKLIYGGILIPLMLAGVFIGFVANDVIFDETKDLGSIIDTLTLTGNPSLPEQIQEPQELTGQATLILPETPNQWLEGESVKTNINYKKSFVKPNDARLETWPSDWTKIEEAIHQSISNDNLNWGFEALVVTASTASVMHVTFELYAGQAGIFNYEWLLYTFENANVETYNKRSTYAATSDHIDRDGHIQIHLWTQADSTFNTWDCEMEILDVKNSEWDTVDINSEAWSHGNPDRYRILIDEIYYQADSTENHIRSEYRQTSPSTNEHRLFVENCDWNTEIAIEKPLNWNISSVNPTADYSLIGNTIIIDNTVEATYEVLFHSTSKQYLAISSAKQYGFESEFEDWSNDDGSHSFSDISLNSTIKKEGAFSARCEASSDNYPTYRLDLSDYSEGTEFYLSFSYYLESGTAPSFYTRNYKDTWNFETLSSTTDRWIQYFYYSDHIDHYLDKWAFEFYVPSASANSVFFVDDFELWQVNHEVETIDYFQTLLSGTLINWDGYNNPIVPYHNVSLELRDRCDDSSIKQFWDITDQYGSFFYVWQGKLDQKEYEFRSWSWDSHWSSVDYEDSLLTEGNWDVDNDNSTSVSIIDDIVTLISTDTTAGSTNNLVWTDTSLSVSGINIDYFTALLGSNESFAQSNWYIKQGGNWNNRATYTYSAFTWDTSLDRWSIHIHEASYTAYGDFDFSDVDNWLFSVGDIDSRTFYLKDPHFLQAQKSYFTPILVSDSDYAINDPSLTWGSDGWDFQEGTLDGFIEAGYGSIYATNGYMNISDFSTAGQYSKIYIYDIPSFQGSYYDKFKIRIRSNDENISLKELNYGKNGGISYEWTDYPLTPDFSLVEIDLNHTTWQTNIISDIALTFYHKNETGIDYFDGDEYIHIDLIRLCHPDSGLSSGYAREFNEEFPEDLMDKDSYYGIDMLNGADYGNVRDGIFGFYTTGGNYAGFRITDQIISSDLIQIKVRASENTEIYITKNDDTRIDILNIALTTEWQIHTYDFSDWDWVNGSELGFWQEDTSDLVLWIYFKYIRIISSNPSNLYETETSFLLANEGLIEYITFTNNYYSGDYSNSEFIPKNLSIGSHSLAYAAYYNYLENMVTIPSVWYSYDYIIDEPGIMKIILHDQSSNVIAFDSFKVYIDDVRLYDNYIYFSDTSQTFNLTITDLFDNLLYQDTSEEFEEFKEIQLTLFSLKVQNIQDNPIWFKIQRGSKYYSEWIFSFEVSEFRLEEADYTIFVYYSDVASNFSVGLNGTYVSYAYYIDTDTAIRITGISIEDVFNNVISLTQNLDDVNASLSNQIVDVDIHISNVNTSIANQIVTVDIFIENMNTSLGTQLISLETDISNVNTTIYTQTLQLISDLSNVNSTIHSQTIQILSDLANVNTTIYSQTVQLLSDLVNVNSTIYSQTVQLISDLVNVNSTIYSQTIQLLSDISNINSTIYSQTIQIISDISNVNSTLYNQDILILNSLMNTNSTLYSQTVSILEDLAELRGLFQVYFEYCDGVGIGLDFDTFKLYVNDSRQYSQFLGVENGTLLTLEVFDYFNMSLRQENHTITESTDIALVVDVFQVIFRNNNTEFDAELILERNGHMLNLTVSKGESVIHRLTEGEYEITSYYIVPNSLYGVAGEEFTEGKHLSLNEKITFSKVLPVLGETEGDQIVDIGGPKPTIPFMEYIKRNYVTWGFICGMIITTFATIIIRELWNMVKSEALGRAPDDSLITSEKTEQKQTLLDEKQKRKHLRKDYE